MVEYPDHPRAAVGAIVLHEGRVLLVKRGTEPGVGTWSIPGGSIDLGETLGEAAEREVFEETGIRVEAGPAVYSFDRLVYDEDGRIRFHYVIVDVLSEYVSGHPVPGDDAADAGWFSPSDLEGLDVSLATLDALRTMKDFNLPSA